MKKIKLDVLESGLEKIKGGVLRGCACDPGGYTYGEASGNGCACAKVATHAGVTALAN